MTKPFRLTAISGALLAAAATLAVSGCATSSEPPPATTSSTAPATTTTTSAPAPTTTLYTPTAAQSSPDAAVALLVQDWGDANRSAAAAVASPATVAGLFAQPYPAGALQDRGCTAASVNPGNCDYRNTNTDSLYEFAVSQGPHGWYVSGFTFED